MRQPLEIPVPTAQELARLETLYRTTRQARLRTRAQIVLMGNRKGAGGRYRNIHISTRFPRDAAKFGHGTSVQHGLSTEIEPRIRKIQLRTHSMNR